MATSGTTDAAPQQIPGTLIQSPASAGFGMLEPGTKLYQTSYGYLAVSPSGEQIAYSPSRNIIRAPTELTIPSQQYESGIRPISTYGKESGVSTHGYYSPEAITAGNVPAGYVAPSPKPSEPVLPSSLVGTKLTTEQSLAMMKAPVGSVVDVPRAVTTSGGYTLETSKGTEYFLTKQAAELRSMQLAPKPGEPGYHGTAERPLGIYQPSLEVYPKITPSQSVFHPEMGYRPIGTLEPKLITQPLYDFSKQMSGKGAEFAERVTVPSQYDFAFIPLEKQFARGAIKGISSLPEMFATSVYGSEMILRDIAAGKGKDVFERASTGAGLIASGMATEFKARPVETIGAFAGQSLVLGGVGKVKVNIPTEKMFGTQFRPKYQPQVISMEESILGTKVPTKPVTSEMIFGKGTIGEVARKIYPSEGMIKEPFGRYGLIGEQARKISPVTVGAPVTAETIFGKGTTIGDIAKTIYPAKGVVESPFGRPGIIGETARGISHVAGGVQPTMKSFFGRPLSLGEIARGISPVTEGKPLTMQSMFGRGDITKQVVPRRTVKLETELKPPKVTVVPEGAYGTYTPIEISSQYSRIGIGGERSRVVLPSEVTQPKAGLSSVKPQAPRQEVFPYGRFSELKDRLSTPTEGLVEIPKLRMPTEEPPIPKIRMPEAIKTAEAPRPAPKPSEVKVGKEGLVQIMEPPKVESISKIRTVDLSKELLMPESAKPVSEFKAPSYIQKDLQALIEGRRQARAITLDKEAAMFGFTTAKAGTVLITKQEPKQATKQVPKVRTVDLSKELLVPEMFAPTQIQPQKQVLDQDYFYTPIQIPRTKQISPQEPVQIPIQITPQIPRTIQITPQIPIQKTPQIADTSTIAKYYGLNPADVNLFEFSDVMFREKLGSLDERRKRKAKGKKKEGYVLGYRGTPLIEPLAGIKDVFGKPKKARKSKSKKGKK